MNTREFGTITRVLNGLSSSKADAVYARIYGELRSVAAARLREAGHNNFVNATTLVNEAWLKLQGSTWDKRAHFFGAAARAMRQVLVDEARKRHAAKRGGGARPLQLQTVADERGLDTVDLLALEEVLEQLERNDERAARVVELRYFAGLTVEETAEAIGVGKRTVDREWRHAKSWLYQQLHGE